MLFTPMLPEAASGTLEPRHVVVPLRMMCPHADLVLGEIAQVHEGSRQVTVETEAGGLELEYKDLADAIALRNHVLRQLEAADAVVDPQVARRHLTFVFVGAGYAGVEALAELADLVRDAL